MAGVERLDLGLVARNAAQIVLARPITSLALTAVVALLPELVDVLQNRLSPGLDAREFSAPVIIWIVVSFAVFSALGGIAQGSLTTSLLVRTDIGWSDRLAMGRWGSVTIVSSLYALCVTLRAMLLVLPGLFLATAWGLAPSVLAVEGVSPIESLRRSAALTRGNRLILGTLIVLYFSVILAMSWSSDSAIERGPTDTVGGFGTTASFLLSQAIDAAGSFVALVGSVAVYLELRRIHGQPTAELAAEVFD